MKRIFKIISSGLILNSLLILQNNNKAFAMITGNKGFSPVHLCSEEVPSKSFVKDLSKISQDDLEKILCLAYFDPDAKMNTKNKYASADKYERKKIIKSLLNILSKKNPRGADVVYRYLRSENITSLLVPQELLSRSIEDYLSFPSTYKVKPFYNNVVEFLKKEHLQQMFNDIPHLKKITDQSFKENEEAMKKFLTEEEFTFRCLIMDYINSHIEIKEFIGNERSKIETPISSMQSKDDILGTELVPPLNLDFIDFNANASNEFSFYSESDSFFC